MNVCGYQNRCQILFINVCMYVCSSRMRLGFIMNLKCSSRLIYDVMWLPYVLVPNSYMIWMINLCQGLEASEIGDCPTKPHNHSALIGILMNIEIEIHMHKFLYSDLTCDHRTFKRTEPTSDGIWNCNKWQPEASADYQVHAIAIWDSPQTLCAMQT